LIPSGFVKINEGTTELMVPESFCRKGPGTKTGEVFYNRQMEFGRDISVMLGREVFTEGARILDGLAATGARGLRLANECGVKAEFVLNDRSLSAAVLMKQNADLNSLGHIRITCMDLRSLLAEEQFDYIDIDPFGSPIDFIDAAVQSCRNKGVIALTATDTAPLYGTYPKTCLRRYGALSAKSPFAHETGLRIMIGQTVRAAASHDRTCEPMLCYHADHYFRCYLRIMNGAAKADLAIKKLGFARYEKGSLERSIEMENPEQEFAGPLWTGELHSRELLEKMRATGDLGTAPRCDKMLEVWREEQKAPPLFYRVDEFAKMTKHSPPRLVEFVSRLREKDEKASRTHFDPKGFKTDLPVGEIIRIFKNPPRECGKLSKSNV
jgi:tRNA (guanine26-N2/guanine27-N2)-dimethyltransferase